MSLSIYYHGLLLKKLQRNLIKHTYIIYYYYYYLYNNSYYNKISFQIIILLDKKYIQKSYQIQKLFYILHYILIELQI